MKDSTQQELKDIMSTVGARVITAKSKFHGKFINVLIDIESDIICIFSRIAPKSEWKKVHKLHVCGFNGD
jgi:hypothetical protein